MSRILPSNSEHELAKSLDKLQADPLYLIHVIHSSGHSISLIKSLSDLGFDFSPFNKCPKSGDTICALVSKNIGLAIKTLIRAGVDLTAKHGITASSLLLIRGHGECGCLRMLLSKVPLVTALPARISNSHAGFARLAESVSVRINFRSVLS
ncbi:unnamed protein product [Protopolystoma xenopodis]|uniref:Uncharacterized protein n=1 Tax=Protopolystoma xenopodis TaxID=117903 RepID=A0A3S5A2G3_9PLAT|nr:unnamed protein product [Protopolystoma xenopodis]